MRILMVSPEANPFARSGGLGRGGLRPGLGLGQAGPPGIGGSAPVPPGTGIGPPPHLHRTDAFHSAVLKDPVRRDLYRPGRPQPEFLLHRPGRPV